MAAPFPKDKKRPAPAGQQKPDPHGNKPAASSDNEVEPLDEEILDKVMRDTPL